GQHGKVLRHVMTEYRSEDSERESPAKTGANYGLVTDPVGYADSRSKCRGRRTGVHAQADTRRPGNQILASGNIDRASLAKTIDVLRAVPLPPQAVVQGELLGHVPCILGEGEDAILALAGAVYMADVSRKRGNVA